MEELDLTSFFNTKPQAQDFGMRLDKISQKIYEVDFNLEKELLENFGIEKKDAFLTLLLTNEINTKSRKALKEFLSLIRDKISSISVISLTLAFDPKEHTLKSLSEWFLFNINKQVLFDIKIEPEIIAGAIITAKSKYFDYSIKPRFDNILDGMLSGQQAVPVPESMHISSSETDAKE